MRNTAPQKPNKLSQGVEGVSHHFGRVLSGDSLMHDLCASSRGDASKRVAA